MRYHEGKTTVRNLIRKLQALGEEHLDKPIIIFGTRGLQRPDILIVPEKYGSGSEYKGHIILELSDVKFDIHKLEINKNTPAPIIKEGKAICPCCGKEVVRSPEYIMSRVPTYIYYCTKCIYYKEIPSIKPISEARVIYPDLPIDYLNKDQE